VNPYIHRITLAAALLVGSHFAYAGPAEDAKSLMAQGQYGEALSKLDQHLSKNPQDASARFSRGLALVKLNRTSEAVKAFTDLTRDYPQLPEPYNNLAVIYAQQGDYEKARDALEAALATHPSYATAHENLGDIYAALAGAAYNRALLLDQSNQTVRNKLNLISQLDHSPIAAPGKGSVVAAAKPAAKPIAPVVEKPVAAAKPQQPQPAPDSEATVDTDVNSAVSSALVAWTTAWSGKDLPRYFAAYADDFVPEGGVTRAAWQAQRKDRILKPSRIKVEARDAKFTRTGEDRMQVDFTQQYESDTFSDSVGKLVDMKLTKGAWKIVREYTR
jgi:tetratricopeptide (TPR) repeat protein